MSDWLSNNTTGLISVNQLHQGSKFKLQAHFLLLQLKSETLPRDVMQKHTESNTHTRTDEAFIFYSSFTF